MYEAIINRSQSGELIELQKVVFTEISLKTSLLLIRFSLI